MQQIFKYYNEIKEAREGEKAGSRKRARQVIGDPEINIENVFILSEWWYDIKHRNCKGRFIHIIFLN